MNFKANIQIMPLKELLDPQGKTVLNNMSNLEIQGVEDVRIGKCVHMEVSADSKLAAEEKVKKACEKLLVNMIMESYSFDLTEV